MGFGDVLKSLAVDTWYKAVMYVGAVTLVGSFFFDSKGITNLQLQLLAGGSFLLGLGEWKNHKPLSFFKPPNVYTGGPALMTTTVRSSDIVGTTLDIVGIILICLAVWKIVTL